MPYETNHPHHHPHHYPHHQHLWVQRGVPRCSGRDASFHASELVERGQTDSLCLLEISSTVQLGNRSVRHYRQAPPTTEVKLKADSEKDVCWGEGERYRVSKEILNRNHLHRSHGELLQLIRPASEKNTNTSAH